MVFRLLNTAYSIKPYRSVKLSVGSVPRQSCQTKIFTSCRIFVKCKYKKISKTLFFVLFGHSDWENNPSRKSTRLYASVRFNGIYCNLPCLSYAFFISKKFPFSFLGYRIFVCLSQSLSSIVHNHIYK